MVLNPRLARHGLRAPLRAIRYSAVNANPAATVEPELPPEPVPGPAIALQQMDELARDLDNTACSGLPIGGQTENIGLSAVGVPGTVDLFFVVNTEAVRAHVFMETVLSEPNQELWDAGTWTVRVNVRGTVGNNARLRTCHICRVDQTGVNKGTVASTGDLNIACSFGVKEWTLEGIESHGLAADRIQVVLGFNRTVGTVTVRIRPNQIVNTPILTRAA